MSQPWQRQRLLRQSTYLLLAIWTVAAAIATGIDNTWVQIAEERLQGLFFLMRGPIPPPKNIVILAMDEYTLSQINSYIDGTTPEEQWPEYVQWLASPTWRRIAQATAIDRLMQAGARGVAVDVTFDGPSSYGTEDDQALQSVLQAHSGSIVLAAGYLESYTDKGFVLDLVEPFPSLQMLVAPHLGYVNVLPTVDGQIRQLPSEYRQRVESFGVKALPSLSEAALQAAKLDYPTPEGTDIFFYGPPETFPNISFWDVLHPANWQVHLKNETFKDKLVLIGATASDFQDFQPVPFSNQMPGVEIHANAVATLLEGRSLRQVFPNAVQRGCFVLFLVSLATLIILQVQSMTRQFLLGLSISLVVGVGGYLSFTYGYQIVPIAIPVGAILLNTASLTLTRAVNEQLEKLRLRRTLERYVAPSIVAEILQQPEDYQSLLKGRQIKAAVLFSDIRGFTTISEQMARSGQTEQLVQQLNTYLDGMVQAITMAGGTIDKFIGDAVMAEFGSPLSRGEKEDAMNAIRAALGMRRKLITLRNQWQQEGKIIFFNGIGINYGDLIAGNIGSLSRLEYTVIGDTVNVASRVEGMTKDLGVDILITGTLYELVKEDIHAECLGEHRLKGHTEIPLYSVIGLREDDRTEYEETIQQLRQYLNWESSALENQKLSQPGVN